MWSRQHEERILDVLQRGEGTKWHVASQWDSVSNIQDQDGSEYHIVGIYTIENSTEISMDIKKRVSERSIFGSPT